jgi:hypothetical protein
VEGLSAHCVESSDDGGGNYPLQGRTWNYSPKVTVHTVQDLVESIPISRDHFAKPISLKGQSYENVCEIIALNDRLDPN